jgi:tRNA pseudouridine32 synthase/23S rRNA pseudouridine746 synthase
VQTTHPEALIVHRLDQATSGLLVLARHATVHRQLSALFRLRQVDKQYEALVTGHLQGQGLIDLPLCADWPRRPRQQVHLTLGKPSLTHWQSLAYNATSHHTRVALLPHTGRTHQLRVHLLAIGHPIVGDTLYDQPDAGRLMLHATRLGFTHPVTGLGHVWTCRAPF